MKGSMIYANFKRLFPEKVENVISYKKIGSSAISLIENSGKSYVFLYISDENWTLGTKLWRRPPRNVQFATISTKNGRKTYSVHSL